MEDRILTQDDIDENEHVLKLWEPLHFTVEKGYDYRRLSPFATGGTVFVRAVATVLLAVFNRTVYGYKIVGRKNLKSLGKNGAVAICNHIHPMDCTMIDMALWKKRMYYVTLESNFRIPLARHAIRVLGGVPLSPKPHIMGEMFSEMGKAIGDGAVVQIYPEGVLRPYYRGLRSFKNGAFRLAAEQHAPIVPMVLVQKKPKGLYRLIKKKPCLQLHILPLLYPKEELNRHENTQWLKEEAVKKMRAALQTLDEI